MPLKDSIQKQVSGLGFMALGFLGSAFQDREFLFPGIRLSGFVFQVFRVGRASWFRCLGFSVYKVWVLGFRVQGLKGLRVSGGGLAGL